MEFYLSRKVSLMNIVIEQAKEMGGVNLICTTFHLPESAASKIRKNIDAGVFKTIKIYCELKHRNNKGWMSKLLNTGVVEINTCQNHSKIAILQSKNETRVVLSSNNWQSASVYEFALIIRGEQAEQIKKVFEENFTTYRKIEKYSQFSECSELSEHSEHQEHPEHPLQLFSGAGDA